MGGMIAEMSFNVNLKACNGVKYIRYVMKKPGSRAAEGCTGYAEEFFAPLRGYGYRLKAQSPLNPAHPSLWIMG